MEQDELTAIVPLETDPTFFDRHYFDPPAIQDPYSLYDLMRQSQPVTWSQRMQAWVIFRYDDVSKAYRSRSIGQGDRPRTTYARCLRLTERSCILSVPTCRGSSRSLTHRSTGRNAISVARCSSRSGSRRCVRRFKRE